MGKEQIYSVPQTLKERTLLRGMINQLVSDQPLGPPLSMDNLSDLADQLIRECGLDPETKGWIMVEINNSVWRDVVASIPYDKRILLIPECLSHSSKCQGEVDELGLLCHKCNRCSIPDLQEKADSLGMMSIVAEGFTAVMGLIQSGTVETVIGVSCLESLEKAFPLLINNAVPGLAIPLNIAGCKDTNVDENYVAQMINMQSGRELKLLDHEHLKAKVTEWFTPENLSRILSGDNDQTSQVSAEWLGGEGKRWRPYLLAAVYQSLSDEENIPEEVQLAAIAVECFHKASLVHDDIQDNDSIRYGKQTVNAIYGDSIAINVGDMLLGEGYRLLTRCGHMELLKVSAEAHIALCKGQGMELEWSRSPRPLTMDFVLDIFCNKTVPAFDVSLIMGLICGGDDEPLREILHQYSRALGIGYQLQDDVEDFETDQPLALRPSAVLAVLCERQDKPFVEALLQTDDLKAFLNLPEHQPLLQEAIEEVKQMSKQYNKQALEALQEIGNMELKRLLFRVTKRILK
ncbi:polyprenyl synthetase family protein [Parabacteroides sp. PF5-9]|uniref:polyprenyl synthetase family protein n=1 Tax=Parabacteroides sp. PF5-9 TaxID=1742404 RepID=UPI0024749B55|nr:polyprenyl synthetase family protein [Parabacteroides sp. PF5-9]MDH6358469.1 geranylgeranyl diphosphate synthase type II [Parabacteroides sp. PF5-9]